MDDVQRLKRLLMYETNKLPRKPGKLLFIKSIYRHVIVLYVTFPFWCVCVTSLYIVLQYETGRRCT